MNIELSKDELEWIIDWYYTAETYHGERGVDMLKAETILLGKLKSFLDKDKCDLTGIKLKDYIK